MKTSLITALLVFSGVYATAQDTLSLLFMGDFMQHDPQIAAAKEPDGSYDYNHYFKYLKPVVESADLTIANLEVTLAGPPFKGYPQFSAPDAYAEAIKNSGIDILMTANNHSNDRKSAGLERTIDVLDSLEIPHFGTYKTPEERDKTYPLLVEANNIKVALLNYTYGTNGIPTKAPNIVNMIEKEQILKDIGEAKKLNPDKIIACMHWGKEYLSHPDDYQKYWGEFLMKNGVDIVVGGHPHWIQPAQWYQANGRYNDEKLVIWSLGNIVSNQRRLNTDGGSFLKFSLVKDEEGIVSIKAPGYYLIWVWVPVEEGRKRYYIMPVDQYEKNDIMDAKSKAMMNIFITNSRALYQEHNLNVPEIKYNSEKDSWEMPE
jgi:poly-gamma-glutamate synthesis protein (capsule biosynthesis protein)